MSGITTIERTNFYLAAILLASVGHVSFSNTLVTSGFVSQVLFLTELYLGYKFSTKCEMAGNMKTAKVTPMLLVMYNLMLKVISWTFPILWKTLIS